MSAEVLKRLALAPLVTGAVGEAGATATGLLIHYVVQALLVLVGTCGKAGLGLAWGCAGVRTWARRYGAS